MSRLARVVVPGQALRRTLSRLPARKFSRMRSPAGPLFSGWNWVATSWPRWTALVNSQP